MAKGQKRSNREAKKPKKTAALKAKSAADWLPSRAAGTSYKERFKKGVTPNT
jgi:hypothetical protein